MDVTVQLEERVFSSVLDAAHSVVGQESAADRDPIVAGFAFAAARDTASDR